jgi:hypothetical protein
MDASFERNNRLISMGITTIIAVLLFILFLYIKFVTPIPPFEENPQGGLEVNFGFDEAGRGNINSLQPVANNPKTKTEATPRPSNPSSSAMIASEEASEVVAPPVKTVKNKKTEIREETPPRPDQNLLNALNKVHSAPASNTGDGNTDAPGNQGDPNGTLNSNVYSDFGGTGGISGKLKGSGRKMIGEVAIYDNSQETGIVAVEILVDKKGKIIKAEPVLMGSTTTSSILWKKAKDGLINQVLFNESAKGEEARGTIYINFTVR